LSGNFKAYNFGFNQIFDLSIRFSFFFWKSRKKGKKKYFYPLNHVYQVNLEFHHNKVDWIRKMLVFALTLSEIFPHFERLSRSSLKMLFGPQNHMWT